MRHTKLKASKASGPHRLLSYSLTAGCALVLLLVLWHNYTMVYNYYITCFLEADAAAEILLAKHLAEEGRWVLSPDWFYSTELRVIHNQLIMAPLFRIWNDPFFVHRLSTLIIGILLSASAFYFFRSIGAPAWQALLGGAAFLLPYSEVYAIVIIVSCYYSFFLICSLLFLGTYVRMQRATGRPKIIFCCLLAVLSLLMGLCGIRYLVILFAPLILAEGMHLFAHFREKGAACITKNSLASPLQAIGFTAAYFAGVLINEKLLAATYRFHTGSESFMLIDSSNIIDHVLALPGTYLQAYADTKEAALFSIDGINTVVRLAGAVLMLCGCMVLWRSRAKLQAQARFIVRFTMACLAIGLCTALLTQQSGGVIVHRFLLIGIWPILLALPLLAGLPGIGKALRRTCAAFLLLLSFSTGYDMEAKLAARTNQNEPIMETVAYLQGQGYQNGFATFWESTTARLFAADTLHVTTVRFAGGEMIHNQWLESTQDAEVAAEGPFFLILRKHEHANVAELLEGYELIYEYGNLYVFDVPGDLLQAGG